MVVHSNGALLDKEVATAQGKPFFFKSERKGESKKSRIHQVGDQMADLGIT